MILTAINGDTQYRTGSGSDRMLALTNANDVFFSSVESGIQSLPLLLLYCVALRRLKPGSSNSKS
jgi:hypothetical protein